MTRNTHTLDRIARILIGLVLVGLFFTQVVGWLGLAGGIALVASGVVGWCALYATLGLRTCAVSPER